MKCLIIDDNKIALTTMAHLASQVKDLDVVATCQHAIEAYTILKKEKVDFLLLDIEMPEMSGIELIKSLGTERPIIVFTTSKKEYAVDAFELNVADYLLKPVTPARFLQSMDRVREILESNQEELKVNADEFIFIRDGNIVRKIQLENILYLEAMGDYVKLYTSPKMYAIHTTMKAMEERLSKDMFLRIHRSYIVSVAKIDFIQDGMIVIGQKALPVADAFRSVLNKRLDVM